MTQSTKTTNDLLGQYFPVLDHGFISLVDGMGGDLAIEQAARTSFGMDIRSRSTTRQLLRYLMRHKHTSPFEMVEFKFHAAMPIFVARQWIRHRVSSTNEASGRYAEVPMLFYTPEQQHLLRQASDNKQGRAGEPLSDEDYARRIGIWDNLRIASGAAYEMALNAGVAKELARIDLPLSTYTQWYWKIDLHNLLHFLTLRVDSHAQYEIRVYAEIMAAMVREVCPLAFEAWSDYVLNGQRFSADEMDVIRRALRDTIGFEGREESDDGGGSFLADLSERERAEFNAKINAERRTIAPLPEAVPFEHFKNLYTVK